MPISPLIRAIVIRALRTGFLAILLFMGVSFSPLAPIRITSAMAQDTANPSGLPLPRFVSLRDQPINVRVGPGTRYDIAWIFVRAELPVEIIQEFDTWRKIRDLDGQEGWIHQNLLIGRRTAYIAPWLGEQTIALRAGEAEDAPVRAWLGSKLLVGVESCNGAICEIATKNPQGQNFSGFVPQDMLWGVYANEEFD